MRAALFRVHNTYLTKQKSYPISGIALLIAMCLTFQLAQKVCRESCTEGISAMDFTTERKISGIIQARPKISISLKCNLFFGQIYRKPVRARDVLFQQMLRFWLTHRQVSDLRTTKSS